MWQIIGASVQGTSHRVAGRGCDDAFAFKADTAGCVAVAVADGAGSAEHSAAGARYAVESAVEFALAALAHSEVTPSALHDLLQSTFAHTADRLREIATFGGPTARELACTLLVVVAGPDFVGAAQIGDGAVVVNFEGEIEGLTAPQRYEYLNQTTFLTGDDYLGDLTIACASQRVSQFAMVTDGLQGIAFDLANDQPFQPFFRTLFTFAERRSATDLEVAQFLNSDRVNAATDDDKTLVLVSRLA